MTQMTLVQHPLNWFALSTFPFLTYDDGKNLARVNTSYYKMVQKLGWATFNGGVVNPDVLIHALFQNGLDEWGLPKYVLPDTECADRVWKLITKQHVLVRCLDVHVFAYNRFDNWLGTCELKQLTQLKTFVTPDLFPRLHTIAPNLTTVEVLNPTTSADVINGLNSFEKLQLISFTAAISNDNELRLLPDLQHLKSLTLDLKSQDFTPEGLTCLDRGFTDLQELTILAPDRQRSAADQLSSIDQCVQRVCQLGLLGRIHTLKLHNFTARECIVLGTRAREMSKLICLRLENCYSATSFLAGAFSSFPTLKTLSVLKSGPLSAAVGRCTTLEHLEIDDIGLPEDITQFESAYPGLSRLRFCQNLKSLTISSDALKEPEKHNIPALTDIILELDANLFFLMNRTLPQLLLDAWHKQHSMLGLTSSATKDDLRAALAKRREPAKKH